jgi:hypothetical protein
MSNKKLPGNLKPEDCITPIYLGLYRGRAEGFVEHHKGLVGSGGITVEAHNARLLKQIFKNLEKGSA